MSNVEIYCQSFLYYWTYSCEDRRRSNVDLFSYVAALTSARPVKSISPRTRRRPRRRDTRLRGHWPTPPPPPTTTRRRLSATLGGGSVGTGARRINGLRVPCVRAMCACASRVYLYHRIYIYMVGMVVAERRCTDGQVGSSDRTFVVPNLHRIRSEKQYLIEFKKYIHHTCFIGLDNRAWSGGHKKLEDFWSWTVFSLENILLETHIVGIVFYIFIESHYYYLELKSVWNMLCLEKFHTET